MSREKINTPEDEVSLKELILKIRNLYTYLKTKWRLILLSAVIGGLFGVSLALLKKPIYTAETTFVLEDGEESGLGQYSSIASMVGIDLNSGGGGIFKGDNILKLYQSRSMIKSTLMSLDTFENKPQLLINRYISFNNLRKKWAKDEKTKNLKFSNRDTFFSRIQDSVINKIVDDFNKNSLEVVKIDKKSSIISVKFKSKDELFAKSFNDNIVNKVNQFYVKTKTKRSSENLFVLQNQADSIKAVLNSSIAGVAKAIDVNPNSNPVFQTLKVPSQKKQVDVQANAAAYQEILKNLELAKITFRKEKPLIQIIDEPVFPLENNKLKSITTGIISSFIFSFLTIIFLLIKRLITI